MENEPGNQFLYHFPTNNEFKECSHIKYLKQYLYKNQSIYLDNKIDNSTKSKEKKMNSNILNNNQIFYIPDNTENININNSYNNKICISNNNVINDNTININTNNYKYCQNNNINKTDILIKNNYNLLVES